MVKLFKNMIRKIVQEELKPIIKNNHKLSGRVELNSTLRIDLQDAVVVDLKTLQNMIGNIQEIQKDHAHKFSILLKRSTGVRDEFNQIKELFNELDDKVCRRNTFAQGDFKELKGRVNELNEKVDHYHELVDDLRHLIHVNVTEYCDENFTNFIKDSINDKLRDELNVYLECAKERFYKSIEDSLPRQ